MIDGGMTDPQIAERLGMKLPALRKLRHRRGLLRAAAGVDRLPRTPEQLREAESYLEDGYSFRAISKMVHISESTLANHFPGRGFTAQQSVEAALMGKKLEAL